MRSYETSRLCRTVSYAPGRAGLNASRPALPRAVSARTCSPITLKVHRETVLADGRQAFHLLLAKCVPKREFSKAFITLLNSHASHTTGATKPRVLLMSGRRGRTPAPAMRIYESIPAMPKSIHIPQAGQSERKSTVRPRAVLAVQDLRLVDRNNETLSRTQRY